jgi:hypothetical protein
MRRIESTREILHRLQSMQIARVPKPKQVIHERERQIAFFLKLPQRLCTMALGKWGAIRTRDQRNMPVDGRREAKRLGDHQLSGRVREMILTAQNHGHAAHGVIDDIREKERGRAIGTLHDEITDVRALETLLAVHEIDELDSASVGHFESQRGLTTLGEFRRALDVIQVSARTRITRRLTGGDLRFTNHFDFERCAVARVNATNRRETIERLAINIAPLRLLDDLAIPRKAEPLQVCLDLSREFSLAALGIGVFDSQQKATTIASRQKPVKERRTGITKV